jgi:hypothetical protein
MLRTVFALQTVLMQAACGSASTSKSEGSDTGDASTGGDDTSGSDTGSSSSGANCPDYVPETYQYLWDCKAAACDAGEYALYNHGQGSSTEDGEITVEEKRYWFHATESNNCIDTFTIVGETGTINAKNDPCSTCEESWEVTWELTDRQCNILYVNSFNHEDVDMDADEQIYPGYLMFDTHMTMTEKRNEDDEMLVIGLHLNETATTYMQDNDYGRGTATPTGSEDGPPEDYDWVSTGSCVTVSR